MANVIVVLDEDRSRREVFVARVRERIAPVPGLSTDQRDGDGWSAVWAAAPSAPVSVLADGGPRGTMVWGDAFDLAGSRETAAGIRLRWDEDPLASWDGFHLIVDVSGPRRLTACVDPLGLLPLYYWRGRGVVLVGTSVDLFRVHPAFDAGLDESGLVGVLLMNGQVGGRTLWKGVHRLGVRHQLRVRDGEVSEHEHIELPGDFDPHLAALPLEGHVEVMGGVLQDAIRRHTRAGEPLGLMLSGGLDSRQIGGFLVDRAVPLQALTFGLPGDIEMGCARRVAGCLGIPQTTAEIPAEAYPAAAESLARVEGLAAGFCNVLEWGMIPLLEGLPPRLALGHAFDGVVGGIHIPWAFDSGKGTFSFETVFRRFNRWAFPPEVLREILLPSAHSLVDEVMADLRDLWESSARPPNLKAWHFDLLTRQRFHVGSAVWPMSFRSWPMSPVFDRQVLRTAASLPASSLSGRRLQTELLLTRHSHLAGVPLDRNTFDSLPLRPTLGDRMRLKVSNKWRRLLARGPSGPWNRESRFYYRTYDFASPGWMGVRRAFEADRSFVPGLLRREAIDRILPGPDQPLEASDGIIDSSRAKMILGLGMAGRLFGFA